MAKMAPNAEMDAALAYVQACDKMIVCSAEPANYAEATATYDLATVALSTPEDLVISNDGTSGRKLVIAAKSGVTVDHDGTATHVAVCKSGDSTLRYVTTCASKSLFTAFLVDFPSWKINIQDPT
jgi:hypothetical protein